MMGWETARADIVKLKSKQIKELFTHRIFHYKKKKMYKCARNVLTK